MKNTENVVEEEISVSLVLTDKKDGCGEDKAEKSTKEGR